MDVSMIGCLYIFDYFSSALRSIITLADSVHTFANSSFDFYRILSR